MSVVVVVVVIVVVFVKKKLGQKNLDPKTIHAHTTLGLKKKLGTKKF